MLRYAYIPVVLIAKFRYTVNTIRDENNTTLETFIFICQGYGMTRVLMHTHWAQAWAHRSSLSTNV